MTEPVGTYDTTAPPEADTHTAPGPTSVPGTASTPVLELRGAALTYPGPPPVEALRPCDLRVERGEYVTVVGPSGSGKSTFLNIAGLLDTPAAGVCLLDGHDTGALKDAERTALRGRRIGFVFQSFHLLSHRSARENVELAMMYGGTDTVSGSGGACAGGAGTGRARSARRCAAHTALGW